MPADNIRPIFFGEADDIDRRAISSVPDFARVPMKVYGGGLYPPRIFWRGGGYRKTSDFICKDIMGDTHEIQCRQLISAPGLLEGRMIVGKRQSYLYREVRVPMKVNAGNLYPPRNLSIHKV